MVILSLKPLFEKTEAVRGSPAEDVPVEEVEAVRVSPAEDLPGQTRETTPTALTTTRIVTAKTVAEDTTARRLVIMYVLWRSFRLIPLSETKRFAKRRCQAKKAGLNGRGFARSPFV